ncbi:MAG: hypothetical protein IPF47_24385 [Gemmatimonadetes bacterium]|nr:hypothetical protein [Gemmatimonadota bacterium]
MASFVAPCALNAQHPNTHHAGTSHADSARRWSAGAMAIALGTRAQPAAFGRTATEGYLTQPMLFGNVQLAGGRLQAVGTLNLEGWTLGRGELNPGGYGEGFIDRRHPHTYLHEVMLGGMATRGPMAASLFAGKGFVPFGSDDPMVRPFVKYPVNHHIAQVMERVLVVGTLRLAPVALEVARFNGDEPEGPSDWPNAGRAMDSWAARLTALTPLGVELSASAAHVQSPEFATGEGLDQRKEAASLRLVRPTGTLRYAMAEWGRTREGNARKADIFSFSSWLAEGMVALEGVELSARVERTERPEEDRLDDPYRSVRPLLDFNILGRTRWHIVTVNVGAPPVRWGRLQLTPFAEGAWLRPRATTHPTALDPEVFYDASQLWMWSAGIRLHAGVMRPRFGRYGAAQLGRG